MEKLILQGGQPLQGEIAVSGSKNAALPILAATLLTDEPCVIRQVPHLRDTATMMKLLRSLGKTVEVQKDVVTISPRGKLQPVADYKLVSTMRGSFCVLGPLLSKLGRAKVSLPGGCVIGIRPVDLHLKGLRTLGAKIQIAGGYVQAHAKQLKGRPMYLGGVFGSSVLATANIMMAAVLAKGETLIECAACEPEITDLADFLVSMGARIEGQGSPRLRIKGVTRLHGTSFCISPDRIEAGTYVLLAAATRSPMIIKNVRPTHMMALIDKLRETGIRIHHNRQGLTVHRPKNLKPTSVTTYPYPGFPTDLQAQFSALMTMTPGVSLMTDKVFPDRFIHIAELNRMGANIRREGHTAIVEGVAKLHGAPVMASDLRASAALIIAGLAAQGRTEISRIYHLDRGYESIDLKLKKIGAKIKRVKE